MWWRSRKWGQFLAYVILAIAVAYLLVTNQQVNKRAIYDSQVASCNRTNQVIFESNNRVGQMRAEIDVLHDFIGDARKARLAEGDRDVAGKYADHMIRLDSIEFEFIRPADCSAIPKP